MKSLCLALMAVALAGCGMLFEDDSDDVRVTVRDRDDDRDRNREFEDRRDVWRTQPEHLYPPYIVPYSPLNEDHQRTGRERE
jgi:hypothetical protein